MGDKLVGCVSYFLPDLCGCAKFFFKKHTSSIYTRNNYPGD